MLLYEIYIKSFVDDKISLNKLKYIKNKMSYFNEIGVDCLWITPFYPSPLVDNGYDVADYISIDSVYGTLDDFKDLVCAAHNHNIKVIIDVVLNHSSNQHEWFQKSIKKIEPFTDYYIWSDEPLNDWESMFKGSCWTFNETRGQFYLHRFAKEQPDLNHSNTDVHKECLDILKFWTNIGVDGFRFDVINFLISDKDKLHSNEKEHMINHTNTFSIVQEWKQEIKKLNKDILFVGEVGSEDLSILKSYVDKNLMDFVFCFNISSQTEYNLDKILMEINDTIAHISNATILFSSHDMARFNHRLANYDYNKYMTLLSIIYLTNCVSILYQGDELNMKDYVAENIEQMNDIQSINEYNILVENGTNNFDAFNKAMENNRDFSRQPIMWNEYHIDQNLEYLIELRNKYITSNDKMLLKYDNNILTIKYTTVEFKINTVNYEVNLKEL